MRRHKKLVKKVKATIRVKSVNNKGRRKDVINFYGVLRLILFCLRLSDKERKILEFMVFCRKSFNKSFNRILYHSCLG